MKKQNVKYTIIGAIILIAIVVFSKASMNKGSIQNFQMVPIKSIQLEKSNPSSFPTLFFLPIAERSSNTPWATRIIELENFRDPNYIPNIDFYINLRENAYVSFRIKNANRETVYDRPAPRGLYTAGENILIGSWNGRNTNGSLVPAGQYNYEITAMNSSGRNNTITNSFIANRRGCLFLSNYSCEAGANNQRCELYAENNTGLLISCRNNTGTDPITNFQIVIPPNSINEVINFSLSRDSNMFIYAYHVADGDTGNSAEIRQYYPAGNHTIEYGRRLGYGEFYVVAIARDPNSSRILGVAHGRIDHPLP